MNDECDENETVRSEPDADDCESERLFRNFYECYRCGHEWDDIHPAQPDDDCPSCGARHCSPVDSEDA